MSDLTPKVFGVDNFNFYPVTMNEIRKRMVSNLIAINKSTN